MSDAIRPQPGPQETFLTSEADIAIYGGAAGGGKTWALLMEPLYHVDNPKFMALTFRRNYPQITQEGGLWDESRGIYEHTPAKPSTGNLEWRWPSGATHRFGHLQHDATIFNYQGAQVPLIMFDELTHFSERQFFYLMSRNRSMCGVKPYMRASTNPDADSWVASFIDWWWDPETGFSYPDRGGHVRWFTRLGGEMLWGNDKKEVIEQGGEKLQKMLVEGIVADDLIKSLTFVPANVYDNKKLLEVNPSYLANLMALPLVDQARLLGGNWKIRAEAGFVFNRDWFSVSTVIPTKGLDVLFWDFATTEKKVDKEDPDFTAWCHLRLAGGRVYVLGAGQFRAGPTEVENLYVEVSRARREVAAAAESRFCVRFELEPGSASRRDAARMIGMLGGFDVRAVPSQGDKLVRAKPLAAQALAKNVTLLEGKWNDEWLTHMHHQPQWSHDDLMDAATGAYNSAIIETTRSRDRASGSRSLTTM